MQSTIGDTVGLAEAVCLVVMVELGVRGLSSRSHCSQWLVVLAVMGLHVKQVPSNVILLECPGYGDEWSSTVGHTVRVFGYDQGAGSQWVEQ